MTDKFGKLRAKVLDELRQQQSQNAAAPDELIQRAKRFAAYVDACLSKMGISRSEFAQRLDIEFELAEGILDSLLPGSEVDDALLVEIAGVIQQPPNVLRALLERTIHVDDDETFAS